MIDALRNVTTMQASNRLSTHASEIKRMMRAELFAAQIRGHPKDKAELELRDRVCTFQYKLRVSLGLFLHQGCYSHARI